ncbi:glycosyl transferase [Anaerostipes sp. 992a]|nr:glycosyl transferase [Anaerostipes sp. 992a]
MELGGAERALLGLLENIDYSNYSVDLFLMRHSGELLNLIPHQVHLLPEISQYSCLAVPIKDVIHKRQMKVLLGRMFAKFQARCRIRRLGLPVDNNVELEYSHKYTLWSMPNISNQQYDLAISFLTPHYFVAERIDAKQKIAWIHTDYSKVSVDVESEYKMWDKYDHIISISDSVTKSFLGVFKDLAHKIIKIENILPQYSIKKQALEFVVTKEMPCNGSIRLLSIGRFCKAKNFDNIPDICRRLIEKGINVNWYLIGYGGDEGLIRQKIFDAKMQDFVFILGKKENPYPYILSCDIYIQPSRYEGNSVTVHEAQMLGKPVVITRYETSDSQLHEGIDGIIVPMDNKGCAEGIADFIFDGAKQSRIVEKCNEYDYSNSSEISKLYSLC